MLARRVPQAKKEAEIDANAFGAVDAMVARDDAKKQEQAANATKSIHEAIGLYRGPNC